VSLHNTAPQLIITITIIIIIKLRLWQLLINVDKTKVMASDRRACHILIQNEQLEQMDTFPYLGSLITEDSECTTESRTRVNGAGDRGISAKNIEKLRHTDFNDDMANYNASVACSNGCESWTLRKNDKTRLDACEMKGWTAKKTNEWVLITKLG